MATSSTQQLSAEQIAELNDEDLAKRAMILGKRAERSGGQPVGHPLFEELAAIVAQIVRRLPPQDR